MNEILEKRSLNAKHFDNGDGTFRMDSHVGHIHYKESGEFKDIDWTLIFDEVKRGWGLTTHSFHPFFPEYSDQFAEFRDLFDDKDQVIKFRAIGNSVKGELIDTDYTNPNFDDNPNNQGVLYRNAFGADKDLILYNTRSKMVKVGAVNNPNEQTEDVKFKWEVIFPDKDIFRAEKKEDADEMVKKATKTNTKDGVLEGYKLDITKGKTFDTTKKTLIGNSKLDGKEWYTYLEGFKAWDSKGKSISVEAKLTLEDGKYYLTKTIPLSFLQTAEGRVFCDTTTSYYSGSGDCAISSNSSSWSSARSGSNLSFYAEGATGTFGDAGTGLYSGVYYVNRTFIDFDTSSLGSGSTISSASAYIFRRGSSDNDNDGYDRVGIYKSTGTGTNSYTTSDFSSCESTDLAPYLDISSYGSSNMTFSLNSSGIENINKTGWSKFCFREGHDVANNQTEGAWTEWQMYLSEYTGTSSDPYLSVTYTAGSTGYVHSQACLIC